MNIYIVLVVLLTFFTGSTAEETYEDPSIETPGVGKISFGTVLGDFTQSANVIFSKSKNSEVPVCSEQEPKFLNIALKDSKGEWYSGTNNKDTLMIIELNSNGADFSGDGRMDSWFTKESGELELPADVYTIEYFAVTNGNGPDAEIIFLAPRKNSEFNTVGFQNYVSNPLPVQLSIREGIRHYTPIEVLCYEKSFAFAFGYKFLDSGKSASSYSGNISNTCNEYHSKENQFGIKLWDFSKSGIYTNEEIMIEQQIKLYNNDRPEYGHVGAVAVPLPGLNKEDQYYAEIYLVNNNQQNEQLIMQGRFTDAFFKSSQLSGNSIIYHFRMDCAGLENKTKKFNPVFESKDKTQPGWTKNAGE